MPDQSPLGRPEGDDRSAQREGPRMSSFGIAGLLWLARVAQSRSPVIHNHWLEPTTPLPGRYVLFAGGARDKLEQAVRGMAALGLRGCNVTTPHKQAIFPLLDRVDDLARLHRRRQHGCGRARRHAHRLQQRRQRLHPEPARRRPRPGGPDSGPGPGAWRRWRIARRGGKSRGAWCKRRSACAIARPRSRRRLPMRLAAVVKVVRWEQREDALDGIAHAVPMPRASA